MAQFLEGFLGYHLGFQMDVCCCDRGDFNDALPGVCCASGMANTWILCLFTIGIDAGMPFDSTDRLNSEPVGLVLVGIFGRSGLRSIVR